VKNITKSLFILLLLGLSFGFSKEARAYSYYNISIGTPYFGITYGSGRYYPYYSRFYSYGYFPIYRSVSWYDSWLWGGHYPYSVYPAPSYSTWKQNNEVASEIAEQKYYRYTVALKELELQEKKKKETESYKNQLQNQKGEEIPEIIETPSRDLEKKPKESVEIEKGTVVATYY